MSPRDDRSMKDRLKKALVGIAPTLASALGGPLAGAAVETLGRKVFGADAVSDPSEIERKILARDPAAMARIREAEAEFKTAVLKTNVEAEKIAADDRSNARAREIAIKDRTPAFLGFAVIGGFFVVVGIMLTREVPASAETEFSILLGALATMTAAVVNYYFGSSADSAEKTRLMGGLR